MKAEQQQRLRELALIMLRDAHGEDFTAEQAALLPAQIEEYRRLTEPQEILSLLGILGHGQGDEGLITEKQIQDLEDADEHSLRHYSSEVGLLIESYRAKEAELKRSYTAFESMSYLAASHAERAQKLLAESFIPGQMHCAKCKFQLTKRVICMGSGTIGAGDNKTEPCPNGCGPLWPVTWKQADQENQEIIGRLCDEQRELRAQIERLLDEIKRLNSSVIPKVFGASKCIACGEVHPGMAGLPCPKMTPMAGGKPDA